MSECLIYKDICVLQLAGVPQNFNFALVVVKLHDCSSSFPCFIFVRLIFSLVCTLDFHLVFNTFFNKHQLNPVQPYLCLAFQILQPCNMLTISSCLKGYFQ